jgi:hypothetical protein
LIERAEGGVEIGFGLGFVIDKEAVDPEILEIRLNEKD